MFLSVILNLQQPNQSLIMPPKKGKPNQNKRKKNMNDESESYECHISAKRNLIPNSTAVFHPRRSLRSSTRLLEIGTASLEKMGEIDVGNSTLGIPEKVGESGEGEMSLSSGSNQMVGQQTFEAEAIIFEQEPLVGEIQAETVPSASLKLTEMVNMVRSEDDDDDEVDDSTIQRLHTFNEYKVDAEFLPILSKIIDKYGDIAKNCKTRSVQYRSMLLEKICKIVSELDTNTINNIKEKDLKNHIVLVHEIETYDFEAKWLHTRLTEILEAKMILKKLKVKSDYNKELIEIAMSSLKTVEEQKKDAHEKVKEASEKLKEASEKLKTICKNEEDWKERLDKCRNDSTKISQEVKDAILKFQRFLNCSSLGDDLL